MLKRAPRIFVIAIALASVVAVGRPALSQTEPLHGIVVNRSDHGVKDVRVVLRVPDSEEVIEEQITDEEGRFSLAMEHVRPGQEIHLEKIGYADVVLPLSPQQLVMAKIRVVMKPNRKTSTPKHTPTPPPTLVTEELRERAVVIYNEGVTLWEDGEGPNSKDDAMRMIREAASLDPDFVEPLVMLSRFAMKKQKWGEASRYSESWVRNDPTSLEAMGNIYYCMVIMRNHQRIGEAARRLVNLDPKNVELVMEHAETYYVNENFLMARAMYEALTELLIDPTPAYLNLGACCLHLGEDDCSRTALEHFLEIAPEDHPHRETVIKDLASIEAGEVLE